MDSPDTVPSRSDRSAAARRATSVVGGARYRWTLSADDGFMVLVAELEDCKGQRLEATVYYGDSMGQPQVRITPHTVRRAVEAGLEEGWRPRQQGLSPFWLLDADRRLGIDEDPGRGSAD